MLSASLMGVVPSALAQAPAAGEAPTPAPQGTADALQAPSDLPEPTPEQRQEATERFGRGVELFRQGAFRAALVELKRAYELVPDYRILFNIGQTHAQISQHVEAIAAFESFLSFAGDQISQERRDNVEQILAGLRKHIALLVITVDQPGADVYVDGTRVGRSPLAEPLRTGVGRHRVEAKLPDQRSASQDVNLFGGDRLEVTLRIDDPGPAVVGVAAVAVSPTTAVAAAPSERPQRLRRAGIGLLVVSGVSALAAGGFAFLASQSNDDLHKALKQPEARKKADDARDEMQQNATMTDLSIGLAALSAGVGAALLWLDDEETGSGGTGRQVELAITPTGVRAQGSF